MARKKHGKKVLGDNLGTGPSNEKRGQKSTLMGGFQKNVKNNTNRENGKKAKKGIKKLEQKTAKNPH